MFRLALKNLAANKIRLGLTALAIVLGVGFVVSSFVIGRLHEPVSAFSRLPCRLLGSRSRGFSSLAPSSLSFLMSCTLPLS